MIVIVDNGKGAENITRFIRVPKQVIKPSEIAKTKASGWILSDGGSKNMKTNIELIKKCNKPLLAIGAGAVFLASSFGAQAASIKNAKQLRVKIERPSPLVLDMKKVFSAVNDCQQGIQDLPENFDVFASSAKYEFEIIGHNENPFFGVHFNPELGEEAMKILDNFVKFVGIWEKYHEGS
jgi:GMP synthase (glutamine-hydrolysing)